MDRNELAARFAVAQYGDGREWIGTVSDVARHAVEMADALLAALTPTRAPVAPPAGKYEPRVADVVTNEMYTIVVTGFRPDGGMKGWILESGAGPAGRHDTWSDWQVKQFAFVRKATPADLAAAGLAVPPPAPTPAPEAKCDWCGGPHVRDVFHAADITPAPERWPTHVRITGPKDHRSVTIGKVYEVLYFDDDRARLIIKNDDGFEWGLSNKPDEGPAFPTWAPAPCPPPVAGRGEDDVRSAAQALIDEVERMFAAPYAEGVLFHREFKALKAALSRPVRP